MRLGGFEPPTRVQQAERSYAKLVEVWSGHTDGRQRLRALVYTESHDLEVRDVEPPTPALDEVLVRVEAAGICASDVDGVASRSPRRAPPLIMGHELTGHVVAAGGPGGAPLLGSRVAVNPQVTCGDCPRCREGRENLCLDRGLIGGTRGGGFAELVAIPLRCVHSVAPQTPAEVAVLTEPLATCVHALSLAPERFTASVVVLGAGTIGMLVAQLLRATGARRIVMSEPAVERHQDARAVADAVVTPAGLDDAVGELTSGVGADLSVDAVGTATTRADSLRVLRPGAAALWLGMHDRTATIPAFDAVVCEQRVIGSFAYTNAEFAQALGLLEDGLFRLAISHQLVPLANSDVVFRQLLEGASGDALKQIITPEPSGRAHAR